VQLKLPAPMGSLSVATWQQRQAPPWSVRHRQPELGWPPQDRSQLGRRDFLVVMVHILIGCLELCKRDVVVHEVNKQQQAACKCDE
jgi:hypothetical protein